MNVLVVHCHPSATSLVSAARDRAIDALHRAGHEVRAIDLYAEGFEPRLSAWERRNQFERPEAKAQIGEYAAHLRWCDALVLVHPTWWSGQPAMLKGWFDRVWVAGVAYELPDGSNRIRPLLHRIRRIVTITTYGSPRWKNWLQGEGGRRIAGRSLRVLCHPLARTRRVAIYGVDNASPSDAAAFLDRVDRRMSRLGR